MEYKGHQIDEQVLDLIITLSRKTHFIEYFKRPTGDNFYDKKIHDIIVVKAGIITLK